MKKLLIVMLFSLCMSLLLARVSQSLAHADSLNIGTPFSLEIETDFPLLEVVVPDSLTQFRVLNTHIQQDGQGSKAQLEIVPLRVGALSFPKLRLKARGLFSSGGTTDGFRVFVLSTRAPADTLLRDIKPALRYKGEFPFWLYLIIFLSCLALATMLIITALNQRPAKKPEIPPTIIPTEKLIPPYLLALKKLEELERSGLAEKDYLLYHFRLSMILREFLEGTYHFSAMEMTILEIFDALLVTCQQRAESYLKILRYCDMVKFAKLVPTAEQIKLQTQALRNCLVPLAPQRNA
ncbi:MAG: hypothetical protein LHW56_06430 [Candidatus Cloacimonetes bacterium]|jgi:hypothetical protein|nr:hypothetical protein [Candidatus Cloacimonadota bacterium]MDY0172528.1 hypothetical protein [Candidatus Cloacimonadaceae bacterium]